MSNTIDDKEIPEYSIECIENLTGLDKLAAILAWKLGYIRVSKVRGR